ncbi:DUF768 domain-containing protein [Mesorhizobium sp. WSM1293]|uniref:DUF768 domain-containing protein n=1 Tax=Mesorhizobium sp. WSM1293 TaxID=1040984 RepID=UPI00048598C7|nr:DUF768 domain-containing protein [Mesorhizobium sp. WSM1293]
MTARGRNFLSDWIASHLPVTTTGDPIAASDLADQMMDAARDAGIKPTEIYEEVWSVSEVMFEAIRKRPRRLATL